MSVRMLLGLIGKAVWFMVWAVCMFFARGDTFYIRRRLG